LDAATNGTFVVVPQPLPVDALLTAVLADLSRLARGGGVQRANKPGWP
jgi:hypothetical protein